MLQMNVGMVLGLCWVLMSTVSLAWARDPNADVGMDSIASAGVRDSKLLDLSMPSVNDPAAVDMLFKEGEPIASILDGLNERGFHIEYRKKHLLPTMTLLSLPKAERIDEVLREMVEPWNFKVYRSPMGQWIVTPNKKKVSTGSDPRTRELLEHYKDLQRSKEDEADNSSGDD
jgi:hypothetical protein